MTPTGDGPAEGSQSSLRVANRRRLIELLRASGSMTQAQMSRATGLSPATISNIVAELRKSDRVVVSTTISGGRRAQNVTLARRAGVAIGLAFGRTHIRAVIADQSLTLLANEFVPIEPELAIEQILQRGAETVLRALRQTGIPLTAVAAFGVAVPAPIDLRTGRVEVTSVVRQWVAVDPRSILRAATGLEPQIDNDANLGALAEATWSGQADRSNLVYVKVGSGIGAGLIINRAIYRGTSGSAGEIGHIVVDAEGASCPCGGRGCLETYASETRMLEILGRTHGITSIRRALEVARDGDPACLELIASMGKSLGVALASLSNLMDPGLILISGQLADAGERFIGPMREAFKAHAIRSVGRSTQILLSPLGRNAPAIGAAILAFQRLDSVPEHAESNSF